MIRTLFIIAGAALVLCIVTVSGGLALGGHELQRNGWAWTFRDDNGEGVRFERVRHAEGEDLGPVTTRTLPWTGGEVLQIDAGVDVEYRQGDEASVVITGPKRLADRVRLEDGRLDLTPGDDSVVLSWSHGNISARSERDALKVIVTAPNVRRFVANGSGDLDITTYDQPSLSIDISGSADVTAAGRTDRLALSIAGSGDADARSLTVADAKIDISGSGDADIAATGQVDVSINGSGDVTLATRPAKLNSSVSGSGSVTQD